MKITLMQYFVVLVRIGYNEGLKDKITLIQYFEFLDCIGYNEGLKVKITLMQYFEVLVRIGYNEGLKDKITLIQYFEVLVRIGYNEGSKEKIGIQRLINNGTYKVEPVTVFLTEYKCTHELYNHFLALKLHFLKPQKTFKLSMKL